MITANKARVEQIIVELEKLIEEAARNNKNHIVCRDDFLGTYFFEKSYNRISKDQEIIVKEVIRTLEEHGFQVSEYYAEKQFADMGMKISWKNKDL